MILPLAIGGAICASLMILLWFDARRRSDASLVDVGWSAQLAMLGVLYAAIAPGPFERRLLVAGMAFVWGTRLAWHLWRRIRGHWGTEDGRYATLRARWGAAANRNLFVFFLVQASWAVLFSIPYLAAMARPGPLDWRDWVGFGLWALAVAGESLADRQLRRFKARPDSKGKTCRDGLWGWSRHPNYFFEWLGWWSYVVISWGAPWSFLGPAVMLLFLYKVTGIPYTEAQALKSRGDDYRDYQRTVSAFFPLPPRSRA
jgi:steroid 5-alpha reductase family enzyme